MYACQYEGLDLEETQFQSIISFPQTKVDSVYYSGCYFNGTAFVGLVDSQDSMEFNYRKAIGVVWATQPEPTYPEDDHLFKPVEGYLTTEPVFYYSTGFDTIKIKIENLSGGTQYFIRTILVLRDSFIACGPVITFRTEPAIPPLFTLLEATNITVSSATVGSILLDNGGNPDMITGICWNNSGLPDLSDNKVFNSQNESAFTVELTDLEKYTNYYYSAFVITPADTFYSEEARLLTCGDGSMSDTGSVADVEGNVYKTVKIGGQWWMAENLKTYTYADGEALDYLKWGEILNYNTDKTQYFLFSPYDYGLYYSLAAVLRGVDPTRNNPSGIQGVCPDGWHVPSPSEWEQLFHFLDINEYLGIAGGKMKEAGTEHWIWGNEGADNASGFTALPDAAYLWSSFQQQRNAVFMSTHLEYYILSYNNSRVSAASSWGYHAASVRCVKND